MSSSTSLTLTLSFWELLIIMYWERARALAFSSSKSSILSSLMMMFLIYELFYLFVRPSKE